MATRMTLQSYIDYLEVMLGGDFIELEIKDSFNKVVNQSLEELKEYLTLNQFVTVPYSNRIDLSKYKVRSIIAVYREQASDSVTNSAGSTDAFLLSVGMVQGIPYDMNRYIQLMKVRQIKNTISTDLDYIWNDPYLYIHQNSMKSSLVTIEYTPAIESVEDITDDYWIGKLKKLCLANAKIILGRVRGKYKLANALYDNDSQQILSEGLQEKQEIMNFLQENSDTFLPI